MLDQRAETFSQCRDDGRDLPIPRAVRFRTIPIPDPPGTVSRSKQELQKLQPLRSVPLAWILL